MVGVSLVESEAEFEGIVELIAGEMGLLNLGQMFITPGGELVGTKPEGKRFLAVDEDTLRVWNHGKDKNAYYRPSRSECARELKISLARVKVAYKKLEWR